MAGETSSITANAAANPSIIIVGAGIGGLTLALTLHQIGVSCVVLEQAPALGPLGVGINIQPNAVGELYNLGIDEAALADIGIPCREWALLGRNGREIYAEPRGWLSLAAILSAPRPLTDAVAPAGHRPARAGCGENRA